MNDLETSVDNLDVADPEITSGENLEVAEPEVETEVETVEVDDDYVDDDDDDTDEPSIEHQKTAQDTAFAEMRRAKEEAEKRANDLERQARESELRVIAESEGVDPEEFIAECIKLEEEEKANKENADKVTTLTQELNQLKLEKQMGEDLSVLKNAGFDVSSIDELGPDFISLRANGVKPEIACRAIMEEVKANIKTPAKAPGKTGGEPVSEYYTEAEIDALSPEEVKKNMDKVMRSMERI